MHGKGNLGNKGDRGNTEPVNQGIMETNGSRKNIGTVGTRGAMGTMAPNTQRTQRICRTFRTYRTTESMEPSNQFRKPVDCFLMIPSNFYHLAVHVSQKSLSTEIVFDIITTLDTQRCSLRRLDALINVLSISIIMHTTSLLIHGPNNVSFANSKPLALRKPTVFP